MTKSVNSELKDQPNSASFQYVVVIVIRTPFAPKKDMPFDICLLRTANQLLIRQKQGIEDAFLFVVIGDDDESAKVSIRLNEYGFFNFELIALDVDDCGIDDNEMGEDIANWLQKNHPGCVPYLGKTIYDDSFDLVWWMGIQDCQEESTDLWPFAVKDFARLLPSSYSNAASTWLAILATAMDIAEPEYEDDPEYVLKSQHNALLAATLCEWLHGFEGASGNNFNNFDPETSIKLLSIDDFFLGYEASRYYDNLQELFDEVESEYDSMKPHLLKKITEDKRYLMRNALSRFFGNDGGLFWALHSSIWPHYEKPMYELCPELVSPRDFDEMGEIMSAWEFVHDGWCEAAYP